ncbi:GntR family transcriptional regulator [Micromonospora chalcea]|uniref:GntR family transcriptional regulator n=1 Tax=Micromonospora chalcea TaxID=1874 RepID=UPI0021A298FD|nr:GntR family transcriptional regulator [Micromonospora chalcea]MCT2280875.1 GntR family transcriptional regulator [Micromonospora chalcea]
MIDPHSGVPAWRQLADALRARIDSGEWPPGALLPPQPRLRHEYAVGKATVKAAVAALRSEGLVDLEHGIGIRVREHIERQEVTGERGSVVSVRMPTPAERATFGLTDGVPVLVVTGPDGLQEAYPGDEYVLRIV